MHICLISVEIFAWGKYGGFGRSTRMLGRELVRRGFEVSAVTPRRAGQAAVEMLDGIRVYGFEADKPFASQAVYRAIDADIYHSQEPSLGTWLAQRARPERRHVVTFRDTRALRDWWIEFRYPSRSRWQVIANLLYEDNAGIHGAVRHADRCCAASHMLISKARRKYGLPADPLFLPSPIPFDDPVEKAAQPQVCFLARLDRRKRPEALLSLAREFPQVRFVVVGAGQDPDFERGLRSRAAGLSNLEFRGFIDQFSSKSLAQVLGESWILINTSARESLPTSFVEAAGYGCAILSAIDPDGFASRFGQHVTGGDYASGLRLLLQNDAWRKRGQLGAEYVRPLFSIEPAMAAHLQLYRELSA
jgi:glycosyltransferase involved in cell wall biosynthesis